MSPARARHMPVRRVTHGDSRSFTEQPAARLTCATAGPPVAATSHSLQPRRTRALPFYLLHEPVIVVAAWFIVRWNAPILGKYAVLVVLSFATTLALYEVLIRRFRIPRLLSGMKDSRRTPGDHRPRHRPAVRSGVSSRPARPCDRFTVWSTDYTAHAGGRCTPAAKAPCWQDLGHDL